MSRTLVDILLEKKKREEKYFKNYLFWSKKIKKEAEQLLGRVKVIIFGSILKKNEIPNDIDILIISSKLKTSEQKNKIRIAIQKKIGTSSPFEIHLITPEDFRDWYSYFIKDEKVEI